MIIQNEVHRARVVKGWAFIDLTDEEIESIRAFLDTGDTKFLPERFKREDYSIYTQR